MNIERHQARLEELWNQITRLENEVVDAERHAASGAGSEAECAAAPVAVLEAKRKLARTLREHVILTRFVLSSIAEQQHAVPTTEALTESSITLGTVAAEEGLTGPKVVRLLRALVRRGLARPVMKWLADEEKVQSNALVRRSAARRPLEVRG